MENSGKQSVGSIGEQIACEFIVKKGYKIVEKNYKKPWGEIDIIGKSPDKTIVFFEVKTIVSKAYDSISPEDNLTKKKLSKVQRTAAMFSAKHQDIVDDEMGWRIDLIAITLPATHQKDLTFDYKNCIIKHYENI